VLRSHHVTLFCEYSPTRWKDGAKQIEETRRDEIRGPGPYSQRAGPGRQDLGGSDLRGANR
jgi:hypothetical protein